MAVTEAMMAGTPVGVTTDSHIGATKHINRHTGRLLPRHALGAAVGELLNAAAEYSPREWLIRNASHLTSTAHLDRYLREYARRHDLSWTEGISEVFRRRQQMHYAAGTDLIRFAEATEDLANEGVVVSPRG